jgi:hypothetical protein
VWGADSYSIDPSRSTTTSTPLLPTQIGPPSVPPITFNHPQSKTKPQRLGFARGVDSLPLPLDLPIAVHYRLNPPPYPLPHDPQVPPTTFSHPQSKTEPPGLGFARGADSPLLRPLHLPRSTTVSPPIPFGPPLNRAHRLWPPPAQNRALASRFARGSTPTRELTGAHTAQPPRTTLPLTPPSLFHSRSAPSTQGFFFLIFLYIIMYFKLSLN